MLKSQRLIRFRQLLSVPLELLRRANVEWLLCFAWMAYMIKIVNMPSALKEKVTDMNWDFLGNASIVERENFVAKEVTTLSQYSGLIRIPLQVVLGPLIGSLTDEIGRKPAFVVGLMTLNVNFYVTQLFVNYSLKIGTWIYYVEAPLLAVFLPTIAVANAYIADDMQDAKRLLYARLTAFHGVYVTLSGIIGLVLGGYVLQRIGDNIGSKYATTFLVAGCCTFISFFYALFLLPNVTPKRTRKIDNVEEKHHGNPAIRIVKMLLSHEKQAFLCIVKKRPRWLRMIIVTLILQGAACGAANMQEEILLGIYTLQRPFHWTPKDLATYKILNIVAGGICQVLLAVVFIKLLKLKYSTVVLLAALSAIGSALVIAFAKTSWQIYTKVLFDMISSAGYTAQTKIITEIVPPDETGKLMAVAFTSMFLYSFIQQYVLSEVYKRTLETHPRTVWFVLAFFATVATVVWCFGHWAYFNEKKRMDLLKKEKKTEQGEKTKESTL